MMEQVNCVPLYVHLMSRKLSHTAAELKEADEHCNDLHDTIVESVLQHTVIVFIRSYEATFRGQTDMMVSVVKSLHIR
nr:hypothetical protein [Tanacetum cinerariifolium]